MSLIMPNSGLFSEFCVYSLFAYYQIQWDDLFPGILGILSQYCCTLFNVLGLQINWGLPQLLQNPIQSCYGYSNFPAPQVSSMTRLNDTDVDVVDPRMVLTAIIINPQVVLCCCV